MYLLLVLVFILSLAESLIVEVEQGKLNGTFSRTRGGKKINAFYGIPYAQPPVGELRFKAPKEAKPWEGVFNASKSPRPCLQVTFGTYDVFGVEDCLTLNVYSPLNARKGDNLPVIVYIFGGIFKMFSNMNFGPGFILERDVIFVEPNYRLGVLGFMSTGDSVIPGNYQLKDQRLALKWVQKNIDNFGGDPKRVTLHGHSSGSACVHHHTLSPSSKGLFHKAIMQSAAFDTFFGPDVAHATSKDFATRAKCPSTSSSRDIYDCLMKLNATRFPKIEQSMYIWYTSPMNAFKPTIEPENAEDAFLTENPLKMKYHTQHMPWMIGLTTGEMAYKVVEYLNNDAELAAQINHNYKLLFPITAEYLWNTKPRHVSYVTEILRSHYFGDGEIGVGTAREMTNFYSYALIGIRIVNAIRKYPGPKHVYLFDYTPRNFNDTGDWGESLGVSHGSEMHLLFDEGKNAIFLTPEDTVMSEELVKRWVNFVESSNPNIPVEVDKNVMAFWEPMTSSRIEYLHIDFNGTMETDLHKESYRFWDSLPIFDKYL